VARAGEPPAEGFRDYVIGTDGAGVLGALRMFRSAAAAAESTFPRSTDDGASWSDQAARFPKAGSQRRLARTARSFARSIAASAVRHVDCRMDVARLLDQGR
jgi:hypothetical protein